MLTVITMFKYYFVISLCYQLVPELCLEQFIFAI